MSVTHKHTPREYRHVALKRELERLIERSEPEAPLPSYSDMIRQYHVVQATIDRVMRDFEAAGLIVRRPGKGIFLSPSAHRKTVGFVLGRDIFRIGYSPICDLLLEHCRERAAHGQENFKFYIDLAEPTTDVSGVALHRELAEDIKAGRLHGVILIWSYGPEETRWIRSFKVPVVSLGVEDDFEPHSAIIDYPDLVHKGMIELVRRGCRRIGLLSSFGYLREKGFRKDIDAYKDILALNGLEFDEKLVIEDRGGRSVNVGGFAANEELGYILMREFFAKHKAENPGQEGLPIDGLLSQDDIVTRGALAAIHQEPSYREGNILIATHANKGSPALRAYEDTLIRLEIDPKFLAEAMFGLLEPAMKEKTIYTQKIRVQPTVIEPGQGKYSLPLS